MRERKSLCATRIGLTFQDMTSFGVFLFGLLIASDNSLEKGDELDREKNEWVDDAARVREKEGRDVVRRDNDGQHQVWSYFAGRNFYGAPSTTSRRERVEFLDSAMLVKPRAVIKSHGKIVASSHCVSPMYFHYCGQEPSTDVVIAVPSSRTSWWPM